MGEETKSRLTPFCLSSTNTVFVCRETVMVESAAMPESIHESTSVCKYFVSDASAAMPRSCSVLRTAESSSSRKKKIYTAKMMTGTSSVYITRTLFLKKTRRWRRVS